MSRESLEAAATNFLRAFYYILFLHGRPARSRSKLQPGAARTVENELFRHAVMEVFHLPYYRAWMGLNAEAVTAVAVGGLEGGDGGGSGVADWIRKVTRQWRW